MMTYLERKHRETRQTGEGLLSITLTPEGSRNFIPLLSTVDYLMDAGLNQLILIGCMPEVVNLRMMVPAEERQFMVGLKNGSYAEMFFDSIAAIKERYPNLPVIVNPVLGDAVFYGMQRYINRCAAIGVNGWDCCTYPTIADPIQYRAMVQKAGIGFIISIGVAGLCLDHAEHRKMVEDAVKAASGELFFVPLQPGTKGAIKGSEIKRYVDFIREIQDKCGNHCPIVSIGGINTPEDAYEVVRVAGTDGVHFSSAYLKRKFTQSQEEIQMWLREVKAAMRS